MTVLPPELANLPAPTLVEEIAYEARLADFRDRLVAIFRAAGIEYDVQDLETDPAQILLQVSAYQDMLLRQRINEAVRGTLLPYASGPDLDILAAFYDVARLSGEDDARLRQRVVLAIRGRSTGGTEPRYRSIALGADPRVSDVSVYTIGRDPTIHVAVFSTDNNGVPDAALLARVDAALQNPAVRMVNDRILVAPAVQQVIAVAADVWLLPEAATSITVAMENALRSAWSEEMGLGRDVTRSWIIGKLMINGVHRVDLRQPTDDIALPFDEAAALGTVALTIRGRDF